MASQLAVLILLGLSSALAKPQSYEGGGQANPPEECGSNGWQCVDFHLCDDNLEIIKDGAGLLTPRIPQKKCTGAKICCRDSSYVEPVDPNYGCHDYEECVPRKLCDGKGYIKTDGSGILDARISLKSCTHPSYPGVNTKCCKKPGYVEPITHLDTCVDSLCLGADYCYNSATQTNYGASDAPGPTCWLDASHTGTGYCCQPLPINCPENSVCNTFDQCGHNKALLPDYSQVQMPYSEDLLICGDRNSPGICCVYPPVKIYECPSGSQCTTYDTCGTYKAMSFDRNPVQLPYSGELLQCGTQYDVGVCCIVEPPPPVYPVATVCGVRNAFTDTRPDYEVDTRIVNKRENLDAGFAEFPWMAIIFENTPEVKYQFVCGATIIGPRFLLTAAHCIYGKKPGDLKVRGGEWQVNLFDEALTYEDFDVSSLTVHDHYNHDRGNFRFDVALIELNEDMVFKYHINSICLPYDSHVKYSKPYHSETCYVTGWGKDSFTKKYQNILKKVHVPVLTNDVCAETLKTTVLSKFFELHPSILCAGGEEGFDACKGDGGGPLACLNEATGQYELAGIVAASINGYCGKAGHPGLYADTAFHIDWINNAVAHRKKILADQIANAFGGSYTT